MGRGTPDLFPAVRSQPLSGFPPSVSCNGGTWSGQNLSSNPTSIPPSLLPWDLRPVFSRDSVCSSGKWADVDPCSSGLWG